MLDAITGPMFSGKTEDLLRRIRRAQYDGRTEGIFLFKPKLDKRNGNQIETHYGDKITCKLVNSIDFYNFADSDLIAIDEFQFFDDDDIISHIVHSSEKGLRIIIAGLSLDSSGKPFGAMAKIMPYCDHITSLMAICKCCGEDATRTYRKSKEESKILIGDSESYEPRCLKCWYLGQKRELDTASTL